MNQRDDCTTAVILEFFRQAKQSLNNLMTLYQTKSLNHRVDIGANRSNSSGSKNNDAESSLSWKTLSEIRHLLLSHQIDCLQSSIDVCRHRLCHPTNSILSDDYTVETLQQALQALNTNGQTSTSSNSSLIHNAMEQLNDAARITFCYLTLWYEFRYDHMMQSIGNNKNVATKNQLPQRTLISSFSHRTTSTVVGNNNNHFMKSSEVLEFCGLCSTAIRISDVIRYIQYGTPIFPNTLMDHHDDGIETSQTNSRHKTTSSSSSSPHFEFPQQRLQHIQRLLLRAIGYDPDYGTQLIQEMFYDNRSNSLELDAHVVSTFRNMEQCMEQTLMDITNNITKETFYGQSQTNMENDNDCEDVTRIVAVTYSEKYIDANTGQEIMTIPYEDHGEDWNGAPQSLVMINDDTLKSTTTTGLDERISATKPMIHSHEELVQKAALLQQEILGELLSMREEEREMKLIRVNAIVQNVMDHVSTLTQPHDRMLYLTHLDADTQRCMAMKKIWDKLLADHDNQAPRTVY